MDKFLSGLYGTSDDEDEQTKVNKATDFVSRVESGNKAEGYSTEEAVQNYASVTKDLSDDEFEGIAADALRQLTPEQRREFNQVVKQQAGVDLDDNVDDPQQLASLTRQFRAGSGGGGDLGGLLGGLLGGGAGGGSNDIMGALGGILGGGGTGVGATGAQGTNQAGIAGLLGNPIVKMVLGLIAAQVMKRMMGGGDSQPARSARVTPSSGSRQDSGGGILDSLFGGGDDNSASERARQEQDRDKDSGGGGFLDALFGGGDDKDNTSAPDRGKKTVDVSDIERGERKKSL